MLCGRLSCELRKVSGPAGRLLRRSPKVPSRLTLWLISQEPGGQQRRQYHDHPPAAACTTPKLCPMPATLSRESVRASAEEHEVIAAMRAEGWRRTAGTTVQDA